MKILLTNDDGFSAPGLQILANRLKNDKHEVWIVAPVANRSGFSMCFALGKSQLIEQKATYEYALDGSPVDCIYSALKGNYLPSMPDLVLSGINNGGNLGTDIIYSGTCGAARQACFLGVPSVALSVEFEKNRLPKDKVLDFEKLADFTAKNLEQLKSICGIADKDTGRYSFFANVNAPSATEYKEVKFCNVSQRIYAGDTVNIRRENDEKVYSTCVGGEIVAAKGECDASLVYAGYVTVSKLYTEPIADIDFCKKDAGEFIL